MTTLTSSLLRTGTAGKAQGAARMHGWHSAGLQAKLGAAGAPSPPPSDLCSSLSLQGDLCCCCWITWGMGGAGALIPYCTKYCKKQRIATCWATSPAHWSLLHVCESVLSGWWHQGLFLILSRKSMIQPFIPRCHQLSTIPILLHEKEENATLGPSAFLPQKAAPWAWPGLSPQHQEHHLNCRLRTKKTFT